jgi:outer membrane immunogenic protein
MQSRAKRSLIVQSVIGISLTAALLGTPARAADMPLKAPPPSLPAYSWTGCYLDAGAGYGMSSDDHYFEAGPPVTTSFDQLSVSQSGSGRGWLGRFGGGCDYQTPLFSNRLVIGVFADYDTKNLSGTWSDSLGFAGNETETDSWAVGPRLGLLLTPGTLAYADGGYTQANFDSVGLTTGTVPSVAIPFTLASQTYNGWFIGGGTEASLSNWFGGLPSGLYLRTEYRYSSFNPQDVPITFNTTGALTGAYEHFTRYEQSITTSLVWRFNWWGR